MSGLEPLVVLVLLEPLVRDGFDMYRYWWKRRDQRKLRDKRAQMKLLGSLDVVYAQARKSEKDGLIREEDKERVKTNPGFQHTQSLLESMVGILKKLKTAKSRTQNDKLVAKTMDAMFDLLNAPGPAKEGALKHRIHKPIRITSQRNHPLNQPSAYCSAADRLRGNSKAGINKIAVWQLKDRCYTCKTCHLDMNAPPNGAQWKKSEWLLLSKSHVAASRSSVSATSQSVTYQCYLCEEFGLKVTTDFESTYLSHLYDRHPETTKHAAESGSNSEEQTDRDSLAIDDASFTPFSNPTEDVAGIFGELAMEDDNDAVEENADVIEGSADSREDNGTAGDDDDETPPADDEPDDDEWKECAIDEEEDEEEEETQLQQDPEAGSADDAPEKHSYNSSTSKASLESSDSNSDSD